MTKLLSFFFVLLFLFLGACAKRVETFREGSSTVGYASWYGKQFHGRKTASGEVYNMNKFTAAHRRAPFGTRVEVTNLANGKTTIVRINDRGPFVRGRIIDLSRAAAQQVGMMGTGTARVEIRVLGPADNSPSPGEKPEEPITETGNTKMDEFFIQVGSFREAQNAQSYLDELSKSLPELKGSVKAQDNLFRVWMGPFVTENEAQEAEELLKNEVKSTLLLRR